MLDCCESLEAEFRSLVQVKREGRFSRGLVGFGLGGVNWDRLGLMVKVQDSSNVEEIIGLQEVVHIKLIGTRG